MKENLNPRILGIDYGAKRIGIAITDPLKMFSYPLITLSNDKNLWRNIKKIFDEYEVEMVILGYPLKEDGTKSQSTHMVEDFKIELQKKISAPIILFDERYSSEIAKQNIIASVPSKKKRRNKGLIDKNAASVILQDYLESEL